MSIYPGGRPSGLIYKFDIAAIDLPIPADLTDRKDQQEWSSYCDCLSPGQRIRKFGQALDEFHALLDKAPDPMKLTEEEQAVVYSKWMAASILNVSLGSLQFETEKTYRDPRFIKSDIDKGLFCLNDFLKSVNSPDLQKWEDRRARHNQITDKEIHPLLNKFSNWSAKKLSKGAAPGM